MSAVRVQECQALALSRSCCKPPLLKVTCTSVWEFERRSSVRAHFDSHVIIFLAHLPCPAPSCPGRRTKSRHSTDRALSLEENISRRKFPQINFWDRDGAEILMVNLTRFMICTGIWRRIFFSGERCPRQWRLSKRTIPLFVSRGHSRG